MGYESVDRLQKALAEGIFAYAKDSKKAAGRALGTIVEIIAFYLLNEWRLRYFTAIETRLPEYGNSSITHNVEYSFHPLKSRVTAVMSPLSLPITGSRIRRDCPKIQRLFDSYPKKSQTLLSSSMILRNSCVIGARDDARLLAYLDSFDGQSATISLVEQSMKPFAIVECKRVGVEEGNKKGPQTIEKAKQGAYVARSVSSLQKIRNHHGILYGILPRKDGSFHSKPYKQLLEEVIQSTDPALLSDFILTA